MFAFAFLIIKDVLKYTFVTAAILTYIEVGPGGEHVASLVNTFRDVLLAIDWSSIGASIAEECQKFLQALLEANKETPVVPQEIPQ